MGVDPAPIAPAPSSAGRRRVATVVAFWLVAAAIQILVLIQLDPVVLGRNDDHMRLAQVADLDEGQGWYDLRQYRLFPPEGTEMHWSRHVDGLFLGTRMLIPASGEAADRAAMVGLPLVLLLAAFAAVAAMARTLGGDRMIPAALLILLASAYPVTQFAAGRIDHHSLQVVMLLVALAGMLRLEDRRWALVGGAASGVSVTIGMELAVSVGAVVLAVGLVAVARGRSIAPEVWVFASSLVTAIVLSALAFAPPERLIDDACDVLSLPYEAGLVVMLGFVCMAPLVGGSGRLGTRARLWTLAGGCAAAGFVVLALNPDCISGPYAAVDPFLREHWLGNVREVQGIGALLTSSPGLAAGILIPGIVGVAFAATRAYRARDLAGIWVRLLPVLVLSYGVAFLQARGATAATAASTAVLGVALVTARDRLLHKSTITRVIAMFAIVSVVSGLVPLLAGAAVGGGSTTPSASTCIEQVEHLDQIPPAVIAAPIDLGASILAFTDHSVLAAPYHRNNDGNLAAWNLFLADPAQARDRLAETNASLLVVCPDLNEVDNLLDLAPEGFLASLINGPTPTWLTEIDIGTTDLRVYRPD